MARYHFNIRDGGEHPYPEGSELPGIEDARRKALKTAGEMLKDAGLCEGPFGKEWTMTVTDPAGLVLFSLDFQLSESAAVNHADFRS